MLNTPSHKQLFDKGLIDKTQFNRLEIIVSGKLISLFYELRILLYLGVMLFSTGVGILIYENIGSIGHLTSLILIILSCVFCFWYAFSKQIPYSNKKIIAPTPYFDYVLLLGCLLFISVFGYLQFLYGILDNNLEWLTLVTSIFFFFIAYRLDHLGVLSLAITALASFFGLSVTPQNWYSGDFFDSSSLYITSVLFGMFVAVSALLLEKREIKKHFTFSYINFSSLLFFAGTSTGMFSEKIEWLFMMLQLIAAIMVLYYATKTKSYLFLIYAFIFGYVAFTYLVFLILPSGLGIFWAYYLLFSCGLFIYYIIRFRNFFKREE